MLNQIVKTGAVIALFLANVPLAATQIQAQDLANGNQAQYQTVSFETADQSVAKTETTNSKNGKIMSSLPESGTMAMLIAGICMIGVAARRQSVAA